MIAEAIMPGLSLCGLKPAISALPKTSQFPNKEDDR